MKTFLDFINEQEQKEIPPAKGFAQFLTGEGWKPFIFEEDFTEPLTIKEKPKHKKKRILKNFS